MGKKSIFSALGPGLLYAGAAIGVSHLVQSTSAGANFGYQLIWAVLLANFLKMPFFEFGPRYATATGKSLLHGYAELGKWAVVLFMVMTLLTMFIIQSAVTVVTAGLAQEIFTDSLGPITWSAILLGICAAILTVGKYSILDKAMKFIIVILAVTTIVALVGAINGTPEKSVEMMLDFSFANPLHITALIALMGWMPGPLDISVWHSVWSVAKQQETGERPSMNQSRLDFGIGYWGTTILALGFLALGAIMLYGTGQEVARGGAAFAKQLIGVYTDALGAWAYPVIAVAAFTTMFSTTLTCLDAFSRILVPAFKHLKSGSDQESIELLRRNKDELGYRIWLAVTVIGALLLLAYALKAGDMKSLVNFATIVSFVAAPIWAFLNLKVVTSDKFDRAARPGRLLLGWAWVGLIFLTCFTVYYLYFLLV